MSKQKIGVTGAALAISALTIILGLRLHFAPTVANADPPLGPTLRVNNNGTLAVSNTKILNLVSGCTATASGTTADVTCTGAGGTVTSIDCDATLTCTPDPIVGAGTIDVNQANGFAWTAAHTWNRDGISGLNTPAVSLRNATAAADGSQQFAPSFYGEGRGWSTDSSASQTVAGHWQVRPIQGTVALYSMNLGKKNGTDAQRTTFAEFTEVNPSAAIGAQAGRTTLVLGASGNAASYMTGYGAFLVHDTTATPSYTSYNGSSMTLGISNADEAVLTSSTLRPATDFGLALGTTTQSFTVIYVRHLAGEGTAPSIAPGTGAGASGTCALAGTDAAGTVTITTDAADTPAANANICTITFNTAYDSAPRVIIQPSNDATWALTYGIIRYRQSDTTTTAFIIRSGSSALPATTAATYTVNYHVIQ